MNLIKDISQLIDKLASFYLYKGIQPSEIADAIFEKQYSGVKLDRTENEIILIASFTEFDESNQTEYKHQVKYVYTNNRYLQVIEQKIGNKGFKVQWSRQEEIDEYLSNTSKEDPSNSLGGLSKEIRIEVSRLQSLIASLNVRKDDFETKLLILIRAC